MDKERTKSVAASAIALALAAPVAMADPAAPAALEELVVTARKREETLVSVPVAVTAVSAEAMERANQRSIADVATAVPGLNINSDAAGRAFVSIRGIGTALQAGVQPGVGLFQDGIYVPYTSFVNSPTLDVLRIEVLRGPQGTLYGKNTLGGAINVITREPGDAFEGRLTGSWSEADDSREIGARISGPIGGGAVKGRLAISKRESDGYWENRLIGGDAAPTDTDQLNGTLVWQASDGVKLTLNGYWLDLTGANTYYSHVDHETDYRDNVVFNDLNRVDLTYSGGNARVDVGVGERTAMTVIAAYDRRRQHGFQDGDFLSFDLVRTEGRATDETTTLELRFDTEYSESFSTLIGLFASRAETGGWNLQRAVASGAEVTAFSDAQGDTWSVFGTALWRLREDLELSAGLRYDEEDREISSFSTISLFPGMVFPDADRSFDSSEVQPRVSLTKFLRDDLTIYGSVAKGYRGGGFNGAAVPPEFSIYAGDTVWTWELGTKGVYDEGRVYFSAAAYYNDYTDFIGQNALIIGPGGGLVSIDLNLGDVEAYGLELEMSRQMTEAWKLSGAVNLMHARITSQDGWIAVTGSPLPSDKLLFQPDWNVNLNSDLTVPAGEGAVTWNLNVNGKGERQASSPNVPTELESYYLVNTGVYYERGALSVGVFLNNALDEEYFESFIDGDLLGNLGLPAQDLGILGAPRNIGVRMGYRF